MVISVKHKACPYDGSDALGQGYFMMLFLKEDARFASKAKRSQKMSLGCCIRNLPLSSCISSQLPTNIHFKTFHEQISIHQPKHIYILGRTKKAFSSQTIFLRLATTFSHYLCLFHYRKPKIENFYGFFHPDEAL